MQYRTMPRSDEKLSDLGFGCMRLPTKGVAAIDKEIHMGKRWIFYQYIF